VFEDADLPDLDEPLRERFRAMAIPEPTRVAYDTITLTNEQRRTTPSTVITCEFSAEAIRRLTAESHPYFAELGRLTDYEIVDLPTGHWPQFTRPRELGEAILAAISRHPIE
jgi:pimeloyl-ACP methyl ester carboxylesterase